jgi:hypothetical protein
MNGSARENTTADTRGGGSFTDGARVVRTLNTMSSTECVTFGVVPELRKLYFRFGDGKENMSRPADTASWFKLESVPLGNATSDRPEDEVGVATRSDIAMQQSIVTDDQIATIQALIARGEFRESAQAKDWAGKAVAEALGLDISDPGDLARAKALLKKMLADGRLKTASITDKKGKSRPVVMVGNTISPGDELDAGDD